MTNPSGTGRKGSVTPATAVKEKWTRLAGANARVGKGKKEGKECFEKNELAHTQRWTRDFEKVDQEPHEKTRRRHPPYRGGLEKARISEKYSDKKKLRPIVS